MECRDLLLIVVIQVDFVDVWLWVLYPNVGYTVNGAYQSFAERASTPTSIPVTLLWRKDIPLKVSVFAWRLFRNRLSSKVNFFRRGIIHLNSQHCVSGCGLQELESHLFLICSLFSQIWQLLRTWLCVHSANPSNILDHFHQFGTSSGYTKSRCSFMHLIWFASTLVIWKERNDRLFRGTQNSHFQLVEKIKFLSCGIKPNPVLFIIVL